MQPGRYRWRYYNLPELNSTASGGDRMRLLYLAKRHLTLADEATESVELRDARALAEVPISEAFVMNCSMR